MNATASKFNWPTDHPESVKARLDEACGWFDLEAPAIPIGADGEILLDGPLTKFLHREGINLDWIFCGDVEGLISHFRRDRQRDREFLSEARNFTPGQQNALIVVLKSVVRGELEMAQAMQLWGKALREQSSE